jgi:hypothetical protein
MEHNIDNVITCYIINSIHATKEMRWAMRVARMDEKRNADRELVRKHDGRKPLRRRNLGTCGSEQGAVASSSKHGNKP